MMCNDDRNFLLSNYYVLCIHLHGRWSTRWQQTATQKLDRLTQQRSYDHDTLVKGQKVDNKNI